MQLNEPRYKEKYSVILADNTFEKRLHFYDPSLLLRFDQACKRWVILQPELQHPGSYRRLIVAEDAKSRPLVLSDWVFDMLNQYREEAIKRDSNINNFIKEEEYGREQYELKTKSNIDSDGIYFHNHERKEWRKIAAQINNEPVGDVTAGYSKPNW